MYKQGRSLDLPGGVFARGCSPLGVLAIGILLALCGVCGLVVNRVSLSGTEQVTREVVPEERPGLLPL